MLLVSPSPKFPQIHSTASRFQVTGHFETRSLKDPKLTLNTTSWHVPILLLSLSPKFHSVLFYDQPLSSYTPFEKRAKNDPKMILTQKGWKHPIYVLTVSRSPKFHCTLIYDQPFRVTGYLRQMHHMPLSGHVLQSHPYVFLVSRLPNLTPVCCTIDLSEIQGCQILANALNDLRQTMNI